MIQSINLFNVRLHNSCLFNLKYLGELGHLKLKRNSVYRSHMDKQIEELVKFFQNFLFLDLNSYKLKIQIFFKGPYLIGDYHGEYPLLCNFPGTMFHVGGFPLPYPRNNK